MNYFNVFLNITALVIGLKPISVTLSPIKPCSVMHWTFLHLIKKRTEPRKLWTLCKTWVTTRRKSVCVKSTIKRFTSSWIFLPRYCGGVTTIQYLGTALVFRNKCHAASLSALRSFSPPFLHSPAPQLYHLPSRNAQAFRRLKPVWIPKNLLLQ